MLLPVFALIAAALVVAGVAVWLSESNTPARREERENKVAAKRRESQVKAAAKQKSRNERRASAQRNESMQKVVAKDREINFLIDLVDASIEPLPNEMPIDYFGRKLNWCIFKADTRAFMMQELATLQNGGPTVLNGDADIIEHLRRLTNIEKLTRQKGVSLTSVLAHPTSKDEVHAIVEQDALNKRFQTNRQGPALNEPPSKSAKEARSSLLTTLEGLAEVERIRAVGTPLETSYDKLRWALNKKQARILIENARSLIGRSGELEPSNHSEGPALAREMQDTEALLWDCIVDSKRA